MKKPVRLVQQFFKAPLFLLSLIAASLGAHAQGDPAACGELRNHYGPFDYRTDRGEKLDIVDRAHFTPQIEALIRGNTGSIGGDLSYTLAAFPNHHRALLTVMRYGQKLKTPHPKDVKYSVDCYFQRAVRFKPDDTVARMLYANFLTTDARNPEAIHQLDQVERFAGDNAFTHYNMGLVYFELKEYDKALTKAHKAIALGFGQTALRAKLENAGQWREPTSQ